MSSTINDDNISVLDSVQFSKPNEIDDGNINEVQLEEEVLVNGDEKPKEEEVMQHESHLNDVSIGEPTTTTTAVVYEKLPPEVVQETRSSPHSPTKSSVMDLSEVIDSLKLQVQELTVQLDKKDHIISNLGEDLNYARTDAIQAKNQFRELNAQYADLDTQLILLRRKLKKGDTEEYQETSNKQSDQQPGIQSEFQYNVDLNSYDKISFDINAYETHKKLAKQNEELHQSITVLQSDLLTSEQTRKQYLKQLEKLDSEFQELVSNNSELEVRHSETISENRRLTEQLQKELLTTNQLQNLLEKHVKENQLLRNMSLVNKQAADGYEKVTLEKEDLINNLEESKGTVRDCRLRILQLESELQDTKNYSQNSKNLHSERFQHKISILESEIIQQENTINQAKQDYNHLKASLQDANNRLESSKTQTITSSSQNRTATRKLSEQQHQLGEANEQILTLKLEIKKYEQKLNDEKSKYNKLSLEKFDMDAKMRFLGKNIPGSHPSSS